MIRRHLLRCTATFFLTSLSRPCDHLSHWFFLNKRQAKTQQPNTFFSTTLIHAMRFATLALLALAGYTAAQTPIPPPETAPTGSVTVPSSTPTSSSRTRTSSGTRSGTASGISSGTITSSANGTATETASSAVPTTTTYPSLGDASPCVVNCMQVSVAQAGCSTITQVDCFCPSPQFRNTLVQCVASNCPSELTSGEDLGQQFCNIVNVTVTYPPAPTSSSVPGAPAPTASNAAIDISSEQSALWAIAAALFGIAAI